MRVRSMPCLAAVAATASGCFGEVVTIDFTGHPTNTAVGSSYGQWFETPNLRFHQASVPGNLAFPFVDDFGAVVDGGTLLPPSFSAFINLTASVHSFEMDAFLQVTIGAPDSYWSITAFDGFGAVLDSAEAFVGSAGGIPVGNQLFGFSFLRVESAAAIAQIEIVRLNKIGFDTFRIEGEPQSQPPLIPLPPAVWAGLFGLGGLAGMSGLRARRHRLAERW